MRLPRYCCVLELLTFEGIFSFVKIAEQKQNQDGNLNWITGWSSSSSFVMFPKPCSVAPPYPVGKFTGSSRVSNPRFHLRQACIVNHSANRLTGIRARQAPSASISKDTTPETPKKLLVPPPRMARRNGRRELGADLPLIIPLSLTLFLAPAISVGIFGVGALDCAEGAASVRPSRVFGFELLCVPTITSMGWAFQERKDPEKKEVARGNSKRSGSRGSSPRRRRSFLGSAYLASEITVRPLISGVPKSKDFISSLSP